MPQEQVQAIIERFHAMALRWSQTTTLDAMRADFEQFFCQYSQVEGSTVERVEVGAACERISAPGARSERTIILLHGGGFSMGSARAHRSYATYLSAALEAVVLNVDYRLAPEHPYPAALEDAFSVYQRVLSEKCNPSHIVICGDSAGGGLALSLLLKARHEQLSQPACAILVSPWADLLCTGASYTQNADADPIATRDSALQMGQMYLGETGDPTDPLACPIKADLAGLAPVLVQAGSREIFLDDAVSIADGITRAGGEAQLHVWPDMIHQWPLHVGQLDEAGGAIDQMRLFADEYWG